MCDFCEKGKRIETMQGHVSIREEYETKILCYDNSGDELVEGTIKINYCPICGERLE